MVKRIKALIPENSAVRLVKPPWSTPCLVCRGAKLLCGKPKCPVLVRATNLARVASALGDHLWGESPPSVFVGRVGYPNVWAGPLVPPGVRDSSRLADPPSWLSMGVEDVVKGRLSLVRASFPVHVKRFYAAGKLYDSMVEVALSSRPAEVEAELSGRPRPVVLLDGEVQPMGPSAPVRRMAVSGVRGDRLLEKAYYDVDARASEAMVELYRSGVSVYRIQELLSVGGLGVARRRRLVPTRWSITAVDDTLSRYLLERVKRYPELCEWRVYEYAALGNRFIVIMYPSAWMYESIEAWWPGTAWNPGERGIAMIGDWEGYRGRKDYASMGGCYYAARLAVAEKLSEERRQAGVVVLREIYGDYLMPLGVWLVREAVRAALRRKPAVFPSPSEAARYVFGRLAIEPHYWLRYSKTLAYALGLAPRCSLAAYTSPGGGC